MTDKQGEAPPHKFDEVDLAYLAALGGMLKWTIASLLLLNAGALAALLQMDEPGLRLLRESGKFFVAGAVVAVLCGLLGAVMMVLGMGRRQTSIENATTSARLDKAGPLTFVACLLCGLASLTLFVIGALTAANSPT